MASITGWMGTGLQGSSCSESPNPVVNFGQPFGHPHSDDLQDLLDNCDCSIYGSRTSFSLSTLSTCHEVVFIYYRTVPDIDGRNYKVVMRTEKSGVEINYMEYTFVWDNSLSYYHGYYFFGWTSCYMWPGGSEYDSNYVEIYDNGSDYESFVEIWDTVTDTKVAEYNQTFTITGLSHTVIYGDIKNYAGFNIRDDIGMKILYNLPSGTACAGAVTPGEVYYRVKNEDSDYFIYIDGMSGFLDIIPYKCGYKLETFNSGSVYEKTFNMVDDMVLDATIHGQVIDIYNSPIINANIFIDDGNYGAETNNDGYYALPICVPGYYIPSAVKNNFVISDGTVLLQSENHPSNPITRNFTLTRQSGALGESAHSNVLCIFNQSVIIPDDPVVGTGALLQAMTVAPTLVKAKTRKWDTGQSLSTSTGAGSGYQQNGSGGYNGNGNMGDAETWAWNQDSEDPVSWLYTTLCGGGTCSGTGYNPCILTGYSDRYYEGGYYVRYVSHVYYPNRVILELYDSSGSQYTGYLEVSDSFLFNGKHRTIYDISPDISYFCPEGEIWYTTTGFKWVV